MRTKILVASCALLLWASIPASADDWNKKTIVTFSQPVEIPGMVLPAGTYVFKLLNSSNDRHIVMVYNEAEDHLYKIVLAVNNYRLTPTGDPVLKFGEERVKGAAQPLKAWFWPSDTWGHEFVYPKAEAKALAETVREPVLSTELKPAEAPEELLQSPVETIVPEETEHAEVAEPAPVAIAEAEPAPEPPATLEESPKTASPMPLIGFLGAVALSAGTLLRRICS